MQLNLHGTICVGEINSLTTSMESSQNVMNPFSHDPALLDTLPYHQNIDLVILQSNAELNTFCRVCGHPACPLQSHKRFSAGRNRDVKCSSLQGFRERPIASLFNTSFGSSYACNPLYIALSLVYSHLDLRLADSVLGNRGGVAGALYKFIAYDISDDFPFADPEVKPRAIGEVAADWLTVASTNEVACVAAFQYWLMIEWTLARDPHLLAYNNEVTPLLINLLRDKVENERPISIGTIFAASVHVCICLRWNMCTDSQAHAMMAGIEAMVNTLGGFAALASTSDQPGLLQMLLWIDSMYGMTYAARPRYLLPQLPPIPMSLRSRFHLACQIPDLYRRCCDPDLLDTASKLKFSLAFRSDKPERRLTSGEFRSLIALDRVTLVQMLDQGARHHDTGTINECIAIALKLFHLSVVIVATQDSWHRARPSKRLELVLRKLQLGCWVRAGAIEALIWICCIMLGPTGVLIDREFFIDLLTRALFECFGRSGSNMVAYSSARPKVEDWPERWEERVETLLEPLIWHNDCDKRMKEIALSVGLHVMKTSNTTLYL